MRHEEDENHKLEAVHDSFRDLQKLRFIDKRMMREYDVLRGNPVPAYSAEQIRCIRERYRLSRPEMAAIFNSDISTIRAWETGEHRPLGTSLKLLSILDRQGLEVLLHN